MVRNTCLLCESYADTTAHLVSFCPITKQILDSVGLFLALVSQNSDFGEAFATWFVQANRRHQILIVHTYWAIWYARNKLAHEGTACSTTKVSTFIIAFLIELEPLEDVMAPKTGSLPARLSRAACTYPHSGVADAFIVACEKATNFAIDLGFRSVHVEEDSPSVIKKLTSTTTNKSIISPIISDIQILRDSFENITFSFMGRKGNEVAHELARVGLQYSEPR
ncbi:hypothetical protein V6N11_017300 [Hibiscus sabdariffa]|uniref:RNase H type-1 domain-containing protein n=1 Tax=Hibiscus sabdariffa TaxID=183260 RepID=A0ABR2TXL5_9ROSI